MQLFVRERDGTPPGHVDERTAVLMLHGRSIPVLPGFDLEYKSYSWARLAGKGRLPGLLQKAPAFTPGVSPARASSPVNG
ncbi:hypothetical protein [Streptomyces fungicidicus]|uniref:hypothetical protein n=1 Tax=Streptomyces fungicidicus TaxID=68203 RepID=UPI0033E09ECE